METLIHIFKFFFAVFTLPLLVAMTVSFGQEIEKFTFFDIAFKAGILAYVLVHFFVFPLKIVYNVGQKIMTTVFRFAPVLANIVPLFVPFFTSIFLLAYWITTKNHWHFLIEGYLAFFAGVSLAMHIILTAQSLREEDSNAAKTHYVFMMSWVYMVNLSLVIFVLSFVSRNISVVKFWASTLMKARDIYLMLVRHLF